MGENNFEPWRPSQNHQSVSETGFFFTKNTDYGTQVKPGFFDSDGFATKFTQSCHSNPAQQTAHIGYYLPAAVTKQSFSIAAADVNAIAVKG